MRVALFTPYLPEPPVTGGRIRIHHFVRRVTEAHEVHLFAVAAPRELRPDRVRAALERFASWHVSPAQMSFLPGRTVPARVRNGVADRPARAFARLDGERRFDVVWVEHAHAARVAVRLDRPWLLDEHNIESDYYRDKLAATGPLGAWGRREVRRLAAWEQKLWTRAGQVICVTDGDADAVEAVRGRRPAVIPNGVDLELVRFRPPSARSAGSDGSTETILFVGLMNHPPNEKAADFLVREVMPLVWQQRPEARLVLCGANPDRPVRRLAGPRVEVTGTVDSVVPYLEAAHAYAFPLFHGAGSSLKLVEALAAGVPLVATEVAVRGFPVIADQHYLAAHDGLSFARQLLRCLDGGPEIEACARAGRDAAEAFGWRPLAERFLVALEGVAR